MDSAVQSDRPISDTKLLLVFAIKTNPGIVTSFTVQHDLSRTERNTRPTQITIKLLILTDK